ncbi:peptidoglycan-associated lipoprotein Pal [Inquilinus sp. CAU 1745]|uniref:peptidoglycan-associated lipoprotein Pal n=1 Tax=Inquilinus sp. CAU 1745 TaxID=3140369 RepID=UPI00325AB7B8
MRFKVLSLFAAVLLVAACGSNRDESAMVTGGGDTTSATTETSTVTPGSQEDFVVNVGDRVFFGFDRFDVSAEARATLDRQAAWLQQYPNTSVTIEGHADERGTREYNLALGDRRANAVKNYLVAAGVPANRITTISYGKERPAVLGSNESAWAQNRRAVTVLN